MSSVVNEELSRRRLIYLIISIVFSLNCFTNLIFTAWKNGDDSLPISMGLLDSWNMVSVGIALPFLLAFLMAYDCGCEVTKQFSKFLFVFFASIALVSLIVNFLLNQLSPDRDLFLEIFGYKPGNVTIELSQEQKDEINTLMTSDNLATEVILTMYNNNNNTKSGTYKEVSPQNNKKITLTTPSKLFDSTPLTGGYFAITNKEKIKISSIDSSSGSETVITLLEAFNQTPVQGDEIKIIKEEDYIKQENSIRIQARKDLEASYQNVDAKYRRHPLNYSMRNVWLWLIFSTSLFTHSIVVFTGFAYKKIAESSPNIDLDLL